MIHPLVFYPEGLLEHCTWHLLVPGGGPLIRTPGPVDALPLVPCRTEPVLKIRAVGLTVVQ